MTIQEETCVPRISSRECLTPLLQLERNTEIPFATQKAHLVPCHSSNGTLSPAVQLERNSEVPLQLEGTSESTATTQEDL